VTSAPERGDLVWISFDPQVGHEQAGVRPAVVLSPLAYNQRVGLALVCPITSHSKDYPFEVPIPEGGPIHGVILADQVKSLDWKARGIRAAGKAPSNVVTETLGKLTALLA
jgi:mRNA interferase MazF